jgi:ribosomal RNA-processing protein 7
VNLPVDTTEGHLRSLFEKAGRVEEVRFRRRRGGGGTREQELETLAAEEGSEDEEEEGQDGIVLDEGAAAQPATSAAEAKRAKYRKSKKPTGPQAPALHSLPPLDPRREASFLETGSSAHVVFLEETSVERALALSTEGKPRKWVDPQVQLLRSAQKESQANGDGDEDANGAPRKSRPSTAREAKLASAATKPPAPTGLAYFLQSYDSHHPPLAEVKRHADSVVKRYTFFRSHPQLDPERQASAGGLGARVGEGGIKIASYGPGGEPLDEDGFTIVLPGGKYGKSLGAGAEQSTSSVRFARQSQMDTAALALKARKQEQASEGLEDFYRFQNRERRKEKLAEMRRQFEEDREKVEEMKKKGGAGGGRRFRPY